MGTTYKYQQFAALCGILKNNHRSFLERIYVFQNGTLAASDGARLAVIGDYEQLEPDARAVYAIRPTVPLPKGESVELLLDEGVIVVTTKTGVVSRCDIAFGDAALQPSNFVPCMLGDLPDHIRNAPGRTTFYTKYLADAVKAFGNDIRLENSSSWIRLKNRDDNFMYIILGLHDAQQTKSQGDSDVS